MPWKGRHRSAIWFHVRLTGWGRTLRWKVMPKMGLVLQGAGALGAYEYGAVTRLIELGWHPVAVTGVSIGAATAAAVAGAPDADICKSLKRLWDAITLDPVPFWPSERQT